MKTEQIIYSEKKGWNLPDCRVQLPQAQLVLVFGSRELLSQSEPIEFLKANWPAAVIAGCSTAGEIFQENVFDDTITATAVFFEKSGIEVAEEPINNMDESYEVGRRLAERLKKDHLRHILILSEGLNINGSEFTKGINNSLADKIPVTGGLAGDMAYFAETVIVHNRPGIKNIVLGIGFYGDSIQTGYGSLGGWDSFGVDREVTRSEKNILYSLDGQPALELYKKYLGDHAANLPASALLFPLSMMLEDKETSVVRTILAVNEQDGSMTFAGDIPEGSFVRLMKASFDRLIDGANDAAEMAQISLKNSHPDLAILISCVGRKLVLKQRIEEEVEAIRQVLGDAPALTGFYSYGEICPLKPFESHCELHNQTMTITVFKEL